MHPLRGIPTLTLTYKRLEQIQKNAARFVCNDYRETPVIFGAINFENEYYSKLQIKWTAKLRYHVSVVFFVRYTTDKTH